ncbi:MAG TPA: DedA family protein [Thermoanaerobaculia bacterium]|nr:DedA family protein [Thermoanaerobaculia bacterium]
MRRFVEAFLAIPGAWAIFAIAFLTTSETAVFLGFLIPGELAVILGGVLAARDRVPLAYIVLAGVIGPIIGDSIGYFVGRRYGRRFFRGRRRKRWAKARVWLRTKGASAVFLGRFTAFLRSVIPAAAGVARLPYRRQFLPWNIAAGILWGTGSALLGYFAGRNYEALARRATLWSGALCVLVLATVGVVVMRGRIRRHRRPASGRRKPRG